MFNICQSGCTKAARSLSVGTTAAAEMKGSCRLSFRGGGGDVGGAL